MTLKELINAGIIGGSNFEIADSESMENIAVIYDSAFSSFRFLDAETLNRQVSRIYSYCPTYIKNCFGQRYCNEGKRTVTVVEVD